MNETPPFDPPYRTITRTNDGAHVVETLADGTQRVVTDQTIIPSQAASSPPVRQAANPAVRGNAETIFLDVPFAEKDKVKRLGAKWDSEARRWYIPHGMDAYPFKRWCPDALRLHILSLKEL